MSTPYSLPRKGKLSGSFHPYFPVSPNQGYSAVQDDSQQTSEALYRTTTVGKLMIDALTRYVVGKGLTPMSAPESDVLGWDEERLSAFRKSAEAFWRITTSDVNFDYYGKNPFQNLQQIAFKSILKDGDTLKHVGYRRLRSGLIVPYVQLISGRMVSQEWNEDNQSSVGGVIIDKATGRETGYCLRVLDDTFNTTGSIRKVKRYNSLGRLEFDLISLAQSDPSIVRGIPILTSLRDDILDYNAFKSNHILQSAVQAMFTAFIEHEADAKDDGGNSFLDKLAQNGGEETVDEGEGKIDLGPGYVVDLNPGEHVSLAQPQAHGTDFDAFSRSVIGTIASSLGMSYEVAMNSYDASFSASRSTISGAEKNFAILREEFANKFCTPVWEEVITYGILMDGIECPEWDALSAIQKKALLAVTWTGVTPPQVDPIKEVNAYVAAIEAGLCTKEYAIRMLYGMDHEEVEERLHAEQSMASEAQESASETKSGNEDAPVLDEDIDTDLETGDASEKDDEDEE